MTNKTTSKDDNSEPKSLGEILDQMNADTAPPQQPISIPTIFAAPTLKLGVYQAISMVMADLGVDGIKKVQEAQQGGRFKYRGVDQVYAALNPLLVKHGLILVPRYKNRRVEERRASSGNALFNVTVEAEFDVICVTDGSKLTISTIGEAFDSGDKATNKAMAVAFKYAAFILFCIPVEGENTDDPDATVHEVEAKGGAPLAKRETNEERRVRLEAEARQNYGQAEGWLRACTTMADLKRTFEEDIKWDRIPKSWHSRLVAIEKEMMAVINANPATSSTPRFDDKDDIQF